MIRSIRTRNMYSNFAYTKLLNRGLTKNEIKQFRNLEKENLKSIQTFFSLTQFHFLSHCTFKLLIISLRKECITGAGYCHSFLYQFSTNFNEYVSIARFEGRKKTRRKANTNEIEITINQRRIRFSNFPERKQLQSPFVWNHRLD